MVILFAVQIFLLGLVHNAVSTPCLPKMKESCSGGVSGVSEFSETVKASASSASSMYESSSSMTSIGSSSGSCSSFDKAYWSGIFEKCSFLSQVERDCYLKWLSAFPADCLTYYSSIADYFTIQEALSTDILDYALLQKDILAAYEFFNSNGIYNVDLDLATKVAIFEEYKSKLSQTLSCLGPNSPLYNLLKYSIETDITSLPCTIGLLNGIVKSQETYFSSSTTTNAGRSVGSTTTNAGSSVGSTTTNAGSSVESSTTETSSSSTSVTSTGSSTTVDVTQYQTVLEMANIQPAEYQVYLSYLSKLASDKMCLFSDLINFLNKDTQVLTTEMIVDFESYNQAIESIYEKLVAQQFFIENADWLAKEAILTQIKSELASAVGFLGKDCCLYRALEYCLEQDVSYLPLFIGLNHYLLQQQCSFFTMSSSSSSTYTQSSTSASSSSSSVCV